MEGYGGGAGSAPKDEARSLASMCRKSAASRGTQRKQQLPPVVGRREQGLGEWMRDASWRQLRLGESLHDTTRGKEGTIRGVAGGRRERERQSGAQRGTEGEGRGNQGRCGGVETGPSGALRAAGRGDQGRFGIRGQGEEQSGALRSITLITQELPMEGDEEHWETWD